MTITTTTTLTVTNFVTRFRNTAWTIIMTIRRNEIIKNNDNDDNNIESNIDIYIDNDIDDNGYKKQLHGKNRYQQRR